MKTTVRTVLGLTLLAVWLTTLGSESWTLVGTGGSGSVAGYVMLETVRRDGPNARAWVSQSYSTPVNDELAGPGVSYSSDAALMVFDCLSGSFFDLQVIRYAGPMRSGRITSTWSRPSNDQNVSYTLPGTVGADEMRAVCAATQRSSGE